MLLAVLLALVLCGGCVAAESTGVEGEANSSPGIAQSPPTPTSTDAATPILPPSLNADRVFADVEALAFDRSSAEARLLAREYILKELELAGWTPELLPFEGGMNIYAQRVGSDPNAGAILVGAHYDTVSQSPGSDDNATGVATVLEIARVLGTTPTTRTLQLALFDLEEVGLLGSLAFAAGVDRTVLKGAIVLDMVGFACHTPGCQQYPDGLPAIALPPTGDFIAVVGDAEHLPLLDTFSQTRRNDLPPIVSLPVPLKGILAPVLLRSDHASFWLQEIGAVMVTDTANFRNPNYHQPTDTPETLDREFLTRSAQLILDVTANLLESRESLATPVQDSEKS
jgi:Peptidase family M28